ncbi:MAG: 4Fe-4S binding protein [Lachnospiraceae bacterium]|nr:4Fe-4S binding protein [uncultured Acetatifactor sp.]MCI9575002.1 4Fe-4S binding protein [Lachnospiraceae bacterium]
MKVSQIVFSPTGGTGKVAEVITQAWGMSVTKIDLSNAETDYSSLRLEKEDIAIIAVPSYGGRVPSLAAQRISNIHGNHTPCVIVCVYGNRAYEDTLVELNDVAEKSGFKVIAAIAEHSIIHQYAAGRPDTKDRSELSGFAKEILEKINSDSTQFPTLQIPGNRPYKKAGGAGLVPKAGNECTNCGLCAKQCPTQAISKENLKVADSKKCISCMRCVVQCPHSARKVNGAMVSVAALAIKKACSVRKGNDLYI